MFKIICVTNRRLCDDLPGRISRLAQTDTEIILREKDLDEYEYERLAKKALFACPKITLHTYKSAAIRLGIRKIHLPLGLLDGTEKEYFDTVGVSVHSVQEAVKAQKTGASYITAGHIFLTDCKKGLEPRGIEFLKVVKSAVKIPVYAIGGINESNIRLVREAGADGACVMSGFMTCADAASRAELLRAAAYEKQ